MKDPANWIGGAVLMLIAFVFGMIYGRASAPRKEPPPATVSAWEIEWLKSDVKRLEQRYEDAFERDLEATRRFVDIDYLERRVKRLEEAK